MVLKSQKKLKLKWRQKLIIFSEITKFVQWYKTSFLDTAHTSLVRLIAYENNCISNLYLSFTVFQILHKLGDFKFEQAFDLQNFQLL